MVCGWVIGMGMDTMLLPAAASFACKRGVEMLTFAARNTTTDVAE